MTPDPPLFLLYIRERGERTLVVCTDTPAEESAGAIVRACPPLPKITVHPVHSWGERIPK
jgi:hypothetical protein